jgi:hypothetical protein
MSEQDQQTTLNDASTLTIVGLPEQKTTVKEKADVDKTPSTSGEN